jgi:peptidoglycan hydrolase CwlO-like protein
MTITFGSPQAQAILERDRQAEENAKKITELEADLVYWLDNLDYAQEALEEARDDVDQHKNEIKKIRDTITALKGMTTVPELPVTELVEVVEGHS